MAEECAAEIGFAFDVDAGDGFDVLGEELREDDLLGEKFGADGEVWLLRLAAGQRKEIKDGKEVEDAKKGAAHGLREREKNLTHRARSTQRRGNEKTEDWARGF